MPSIHKNVTRGTNWSRVGIIYDASYYQNDIKLLTFNSKKRNIFTQYLQKVLQEVKTFISFLVLIEYYFEIIVAK